MNTQETMVDLCTVAASRLQTAALHVVRQLQRGETVHLLLQEEPSLMLQSLNLQLRHMLSWQISVEEMGKWRVLIRHREDVAPRDLMDILSRDHQRLDELFGLSLQRVNAGKVCEAAPFVMEFAAGLKRHIQIENDILAPSFRIPDPEPVAIMLHEHDDILVQTANIESLFAGEEPVQAWEVSPFLAILSGVMAKHEHREEQNLFPQWDIALRMAASEDRQALLTRVQQILSNMQQ
ncbi:MAG TPA: hemerythrin [Betaproteobacteria bacterium]|nr:hemerythrin [Betaproteobacteria bacterium]